MCYVKSNGNEEFGGGVCGIIRDFVDGSWWSVVNDNGWNVNLFL